MAAVGRTAAVLLLERLVHGDDSPPKEVTLPSDIVSRSSTGPAPTG
jgi:DNA-binding LacI/PurR family transcriptional regulator